MLSKSEAFYPDYPTPGALAYRDGFVTYAAAGGLHAIPPHILSWAIDRAIQAGKPPQVAGLAFADTYYRVQMKPDYQDAQRRNGILKREAFLLSEYEKELQSLSS